MQAALEEKTEAKQKFISQLIADLAIDKNSSEDVHHRLLYILDQLKEAVKLSKLLKEYHNEISQGDIKQGLSKIVVQSKS